MSPLPFSDGHGNAMDDAHIRAILIEYLKASDEKIRIYQEKSIGASICDVMTVTDKLSGYEIKSDVDNLERLRKQIASYDLFFDRCYIVCGRVHEARLEELVPSHWGILCVTECSITLVRKAFDACSSRSSEPASVSVPVMMRYRSALPSSAAGSFPSSGKSSSRTSL